MAGLAASRRAGRSVGDRKWMTVANEKEFLEKNFVAETYHEKKEQNCCVAYVECLPNFHTTCPKAENVLK
jgi:hypothetical protein